MNSCVANISPPPVFSCSFSHLRIKYSHCSAFNTSLMTELATRKTKPWPACQCVRTYCRSHHHPSIDDDPGVSGEPQTTCPRCSLLFFHSLCVCVCVCACVKKLGKGDTQKKEDTMNSTAPLDTEAPSPVVLSYIRKHNLAALVDTIVQHTLEEKPQNPFQFIADRVRLERALRLKGRSLAPTLGSQ